MWSREAVRLWVWEMGSMSLCQGQTPSHKSTNACVCHYLQVICHINWFHMMNERLNTKTKQLNRILSIDKIKNFKRYALPYF